ncbi:MAG: DUF6364 family protein [Sphingobacteriaceae bacterium]|nr:DUF6364 family protein [Sphingobacteriaceae bacterium]
MNTKLTLTMDPLIIEQAKKYAKQRGRSLSDLIENYLKAIVMPVEEAKLDLPPTVKALKGAFKLPADFDYKKAMTDALTEKYLK